MNDLVPLKVLVRSELEASVLRSADADQAPPEALKRAAATLGVAASLLALSSSAGAASVAGAGATGLLKSLLIGLGAGALVSGALATTSLMTESSPAPQPAVQRPAVGAEMERPLRGAALASTESATPTRVPNASLQSRANPISPRASELSPSSPAGTEPAAGTTASIAEEVAEIDRARALVAAGKASDALRVLDGYARRWPDGVMALEASVVRVEVELARGNRAAAERHARALTAAHPNTGHARKVVSLLERSNEE